jgi:hypothetical protein
VLGAARSATAAAVDCTNTDCVVSDNGASIRTGVDKALSEFKIGSTDFLADQEFFITFGAISAGNPLTDDRLADVLPDVSAVQDEETNEIEVVFQTPALKAVVHYHLIGGGPLTATVSYSISVTNFGAQNETLSLVDYVDFDLLGIPVDDTLVYTPNTMTWTKSTALATAASQNAVTGFDVGSCCIDNLFGRLDANGNLGGAAGPVMGDVSGAFQDNLVVAGDGGTASLSRQLEIVLQNTSAKAPLLHPLGLLLLVTLLAGVGTLRRRRFEPHSR